MDIAARTGQLFAIFESQEFDGLEALLAPDAKMKQNGNPSTASTGCWHSCKVSRTTASP